MKLPKLKIDRLSRSSTSTVKRIKAPKFMSDLYADLRDRRLLPLVVLLLVAIVGVPFLLGKKGGEETPIEAQAIVVTPTSSSNGSFSVVPAASQLRAYGDRLGYRKPRDPFDLESNGSGEGGTAKEPEQGPAQESGGQSTATQSTATQPTAAQPEVSTESGETVTKTVTITKPKVVKATVKAQVGVAAVIKAGFVDSKEEPKPLEIEDQTRLPKNNPAIVYTGASKKGGALFLMTSQVTEFSGKGHCVIGGAVCQVIELQPEDSETFAIGYGETRYKVYLVGFEPIVKEEVIEAEGKKIRVPSKEKGKSKGEAKSQGKIGTEPSPRWLVRSASAAVLGAHSFSK